MKGANDKRLVPELRFPEFKKDWGKNVLRAIIKTITPPKKLQTTEYHKKGLYPIIDQSQSFICGFSDDESALLNKEKEDVVIFGDHTCILKLVNFTFIQGADGIKIFKSSNPSIVRTDYIYQFLSAYPISIKEYKRYYSELKEIIVCYSCNIIEQEKIVECLSSIDEEINAIKEKVEQLKGHKKGLMQKLFPIVGNFVPELRFPEFKKANEWDFINGCNLFASIVDKNHNSELPILAITQAKGAVPRELIDYKVIVSDNSIKNYKIVEKGDFIISLRSFQGGIEYSNYRGLCSPAYIVLRKKIDVACNNFYRYYFKSANYILDLNRNIEGIRDGKMISYLQFSNIKHPFPSPAEQQKIAECLSSIDELISLYENKVTLLEQHKKGLMQRLFPKL